MWDELPSSASTRLERHHRALECALIGLRVDPHGVQAAVPEQRRYRRDLSLAGFAALGAGGGSPRGTGTRSGRATWARLSRRWTIRRRDGVVWAAPWRGTA